MTFQAAKIFIKGNEISLRVRRASFEVNDVRPEEITIGCLDTGSTIAEFDVECAVPLGGFDFATAKYFGAREADLAASLGDVSIKLTRKYGLLFHLHRLSLQPHDRRERRRLRLAFNRTKRTVMKLQEVHRG